MISDKSRNRTKRKSTGHDSMRRLDELLLSRSDSIVLLSCDHAPVHRRCRNSFITQKSRILQSYSRFLYTASIFLKRSVSARQHPDGFSKGGSSVSRGIQTEGLDSSPRDIEEKKFACRAVQTEVPDSSSRDTDDLAKLQADFEKLFLGEDTSDVTLKLQGKVFPAHTAVLRARSPVFDVMFKHDMSEKQSGGVTIEDCDPETFPDFLYYMYTGSAEKLSEANVCHIFRDADKYAVLRLRAHCVEFMKSHLSLETFFDFLTVALKHGEGDLVRAATEFFCDHVVEIGQSVEWQTFIQNNPTVGNELFLKAVSRWKPP